MALGEGLDRAEGHGVIAAQHEDDASLVEQPARLATGPFVDARAQCVDARESRATVAERSRAVPCAAITRAASGFASRFHATTSRGSGSIAMPSA
jgi:hypothetical protein